MTQAAHVRATLAQVLSQVLPLGRQQAESLRALNDLLPSAQERLPEAERKLAQEIAYGVCRWFTRLDKLLNPLLEHPLKARDRDLHALLLVGLYQLYYTRIPDHAAISETVEATRQLEKPWASRLVNGILRRVQREKSQLETALPDSDAIRSAHPQWLVDKLKAAWPDHYAAMLEANNQQAPLTLRVNLRKQSREQYLTELRAKNINASPCSLSPAGIRLERSANVVELPGYAEGWFSVQDEAAQLAAQLLAPHTGERVLDACAAPGGKTTHLLEHADIHCVAIDADPRRCERIHQNLERLQLSAEVHALDLQSYATQPEVMPFDRILLDAPCSATGIIRRHPDIKWLRRQSDINALAEQQLSLLKTAFALLKEGGTLLYATCSVLPQENDRIVARFLAETPAAILQALQFPSQIPPANGIPTPTGFQLLPTVQGHDGFFYAMLRRETPSGEGSESGCAVQAKINAPRHPNHTLGASDGSIEAAFATDGHLIA
ncbi:Ribosomal RNA small subunit methyltransferase B [gamma proteobacterium HdN1]|nr:Ribosomal RNA small subunit methyltransferase B [gamma proteobacterium HdN1]